MLRTILLTVPAGRRAVQPASGTVLKLVTLSGVTSLNAVIHGQPIKLYQSDMVKYQEKDRFKEFELDNTAGGSPAVVELVVGDGDVTTANFSGNVTVASGSIALSAAPPISTDMSNVARVGLATANTGSLVAANSNRLGVFLQSEMANIGPCKIGKNPLSGSDRGILLYPGETIWLPTTQDVYGHNDAAWAGGAATLYFWALELLR